VILPIPLDTKMIVGGVAFAFRIRGSSKCVNVAVPMTFGVNVLLYSSQGERALSWSSRTAALLIRISR
jgi:hypothetical protein